MDRLTRIRQILQQRGVTGSPTRGQVLEALLSLPRPGSDGTRDPWAELLTLTPQERKALGLRPDPAVRGRTRAQITAPDEIPPKVTKAALRVAKMAVGLKGLPGLTKVKKLALWDPVLRVRVQAIACRNDDGKLSIDGSAGQPLQEIGEAVVAAIAVANPILATAGIELVFYPSADVERKDDTHLNEDVSIPPERLTSLSKDDIDEVNNLVATFINDGYRDQVARNYKGKLVIFFAEGNHYEWDEAKKCWASLPYAGGAHSGWLSEHVRYSGRIYKTDAVDHGCRIAHELTHYFHNNHTFPGDPYYISADRLLSEEQKKTLGYQEKADVLLQEVTRLLNLELDTGKTAAQAVEIFDYDLPWVSDTPPDEGGEVIAYLNLAAGYGGGCGPVGTVSVQLKDGSTASYTPDRGLVASYYYGCTQFGLHYSEQQAVRMRDSLVNDNRRHLVAVQLGETAYPGEVVCATWNPNLNGQVYRWGYAFDDFKKMYDQMYAEGMRLTAQQAYVRGGTNLYDGIWNPGTQNQVVIWGWTVEHFQAKYNELMIGGMRLIHLNSYLLPNGEVRVNAIWNPGDYGQHWIQGWTQTDCANHIVEMSNQGFRLVHLNGWNLPDGDARFDAIWDPGSQPQDFILSWTADDFRAKYAEMWDQGYKLLLLDAHRAGGELRYDAVWNPDPGPQFVVWGMTREQVRQYYDEMWQVGMKLTSMNSVRF